MLIHEIDSEDPDEWLCMRQTLWPQHNESQPMNTMDEIRRDHNSQVYVFAQVDGELGGFIEVTTRSYAEDCLRSPVGYIEG